MSKLLKINNSTCGKINAQYVSKVNNTVVQCGKVAPPAPPSLTIIGVRETSYGADVATEITLNGTTYWVDKNGNTNITGTITEEGNTFTLQIHGGQDGIGIFFVSGSGTIYTASEWQVTISSNFEFATGHYPVTLTLTSPTVAYLGYYND